MINTAIEKNQYYLSDPQTEVGSLATNLGYSGRDKDDALNLYRAARSASNSGEINDYIVNAVRLINLITTDDSNALNGLGSRIFKESLDDYGYLDDKDIIDLGVTFGFGFNYLKNNSLSLGFKFGERKSDFYNLHDEKYFKLYITLISAEKWFIKKRK